MQPSGLDLPPPGLAVESLDRSLLEVTLAFDVSLRVFALTIRSVVSVFGLVLNVLGQHLLAVGRRVDDRGIAVHDIDLFE